MHIPDWFPLGLTGWISVQSKGLSRDFFNATFQKHLFFGTQLSCRAYFLHLKFFILSSQPIGLLLSLTQQSPHSSFTCRLNVFPILFLTFIVKEKNISGKKKEREKGRKKRSVSIWLKAKEWIVGTLSCLLERRQSTSHSGKKWCVIYHIWRQMITGNELVGWGKDILLVVAYL